MNRIALKQGMEIAICNVPCAIAKTLKLYNQMALQNNLAQAKARIKVEFDQNRELALMIYEKYESQMDDRIKAIYKEFF